MIYHSIPLTAIPISRHNDEYSGSYVEKHCRDDDDDDDDDDSMSLFTIL